jgi:DNA-binding NarL/FixJ family response regulator
VVPADLRALGVTSPRTVERHVGSLLARTGTRTRAELAELARVSAQAAAGAV